MAERVYLHIGLPKTATTYLQHILWGNRAEIERHGVRLPGQQRHDHYWSTRVVREDPTFRKFGPARTGAWQRLCDDVAAWPQVSLISHEFFAAASAEQAARAVADLAPAEVHVVVTAREPLGLFAASWQESIKNRDTRPMAEYGQPGGPDSGIWNWNTLDLRLVLERWAPTVGPDRVHVLPVPGPSYPPREIWDRFAGLVGIRADSVDLSGTFPNASMGVVEAETLRRINAHLGEFNSAIDRGTYIRSFLADERLVPRRGERFWPQPGQVEEARTRGRAAVEHIVSAGYDVIGELDSLLVPDDLPERRTPDTVTDAEVAGVAVELVATMLGDVRHLRHERRDLRHELAAQRHLAENPGLRLAIATRFPRLRRFVLRDERPST